jgi:hypothetical protein
MVLFLSALLQSGMWGRKAHTSAPAHQHAAERDHSFRRFCVFVVLNVCVFF